MQTFEREVCQRLPLADAAFRLLDFCTEDGFLDGVFPGLAKPFGPGARFVGRLPAYPDPSSGGFNACRLAEEFQEHGLPPPSCVASLSGALARRRGLVSRAHRLTPLKRGEK